MAKKKEDDGAPENEPMKVGYVLASGVNMGQVVECVVLRIYSAAVRTADLAKAETPDVIWQNQAVYSIGKEPGTWHNL